MAVFESLEDRLLLACNRLVGVDFDQVGGSSPDNWTQVNSISGIVDLTNLPNEQGNDSSIGLRILAETTAASAAPTPSTIPTHVQSLAGLDGYIQSTDSISISWTGLTGGSQYEVWVFGSNGSEGVNQLVEINSGAVSFTQDTAVGDLAVNDETGTADRSLDSYAKLVTVGFSGQISILIRSGTSFSLAGLAIREVLPPGPDIDVQGNDISIPNGDLSPDVADGTHFGGNDVFTGTTTHTFNIRNIGDENLRVNSIDLVGDQAVDFALQNVSLPMDVMPCETATFDVQFDPSLPGAQQTTVQIETNDGDENPYQFRILGFGTFDIGPDRFEPNDSIANAVDLGTGDQRHDELTIHTSGNLDDFLWHAPADGTLTVDLLFTHAFGNLELRLRSPEPPFFPRLKDSATQTDNEQVSIDVVENQPVIIEVFGTGGSLQPDYDLVIDGPEPVGPEIAVQGNGITIFDGDPLASSADGTDFGIVAVNGGPISHAFTIQNIGTEILDLTGAPVTIEGSHPSDFSVTQPSDTAIAPGESTMFQLAFAPSAAGLRTAVVSIGNNDTDENPYEFLIRGYGGASTLVGVDFGDTTTTLSNWTPVGAVTTPVTLSDLVTESGLATPYDLEINYSGGMLNTSAATADVATVPQHLRALDGIDGQIFMSQPHPNITMTWKDLTPGQVYEVWVFALESVFPIMQDATLTGANSVKFGQLMNPGQLFINGAVGDISLRLDQYAELITADASGEIEIFVQPFIRGIVAGSGESEGEIIQPSAATRNDAVISGVAIRELMPSSVMVTPTSGLETTEAGGQATFTVALATVPTGDVTIEFASSDTTEGTVAPSTIVFTPSNALSPQTVTITGKGDLDDDGDVPYTITATVFSTDPNYDGIAVPEISVTNTNVVQALEFGDAPLASQSGFASNYPTQLPDGARHAASELVLGVSVDTELDGTPTVAADGDGQDEDGVVVISSLVTTATGNTTASVLVTASAAGKLDAWLDFNRDGDWLDTGEQIAASIDVSAGQNFVGFTIPAGASVGDTYARFRLSSAGGLMPDGPAEDGEVEDYRLTIQDGDTGINASLNLLVGSVEVVANDAEVVVRHEGFELFRAPGNTLASGEFVGTDGDDTVLLGNLASILASPIPLIYDGGAGRDILMLTDSEQILDLTDTVLNQLANLEVIDIVGNGSNELTISVQSVLDVADANGQLLVRHDDGDTIIYQDTWNVEVPTFVDGEYVHHLRQGAAQLFVRNTLPWQNPLNRLDSNRDGSVSPVDVLVDVNTLNSLGSRQLANPAPGAVPPFYHDSNGDGFVSPVDPLQKINFINDPTRGVPEGESSHPETDRTFVAITHSLGSDLALVRWSDARVRVERAGSGSKLTVDELIAREPEPWRLAPRQALLAKHLEIASKSDPSWEDLIELLARNALATPRPLPLWSEQVR